MIGPTRLSDNCESPWDSRRLWSLWDMVNFQVFALCHLLRQLLLEEVEMGRRVAVKDALRTVPATTPLSQAVANITPPQPLAISEDDQKRMDGWLSIAGRIAVQLQLEAAEHRINLFKQRLRQLML